MHMKITRHLIESVSFLKNLAQMKKVMMNYGLLIITIQQQHTSLYGEMISCQTATSMMEQKQMLFIMSNVQLISLHLLLNQLMIIQQQMYQMATQLLRLMKSKRLQKITKQMMLLSNPIMMLHLHLPKELCQKYHRLKSMIFQQRLLLI